MSRLWLLISLVALAGCGDDAENINKPLSRYYYGYMHYPTRIVPATPKEKNIVVLEYEHDRVVRRTGGVLATVQPGVDGYLFSDLVYDTLIYTDHQVVIDKRGKPFLNEVFKRTIQLEGQKMVQRVTERQLPGYTDTTDYFYDGAGKLVSATSRGAYFSLEGISRYQVESTYHYGGDDNLDSIVSLGNGSPLVMQHAVDIFAGYDQAENPLKGLMIFEELFYRSLSENNYTTYQHKIYHPETGAAIVVMEYTWDLIYDEGRVVFDDY